MNDSHGHAAGDRVLREVGEALAGTCRLSDLAFRVGGDEFAYILPESDHDAATAAAGRAAGRSLRPSTASGRPLPPCIR